MGEGVEYRYAGVGYGGMEVKLIIIRMAYHALITSRLPTETNTRHGGHAGGMP